MEQKKEKGLRIRSCLTGVEYKKLGEIAHYAKERINASEVDVNSYVGVENLLQNKQGKIYTE